MQWALRNVLAVQNDLIPAWWIAGTVAVKTNTFGSVFLEGKGRGATFLFTGTGTLYINVLGSCHKHQRRKRESETAKREKSQTPRVLTAILTLPILTQPNLT